MAETQALSLDDPIYSVMIGDQSIIITLANILEVAKLKNELTMAHQRASDLDVELTAAKKKLAVYWTKILEGHLIIGDFKRQLAEKDAVTKRLMQGLEQEIGWRGMIGAKHYLQGKFVKEMGREFIEIVGHLSGWLKRVKMEGGGGSGEGREKMELEILRGIPVVLKGLKEKLEEGEVNKREGIIRDLGVMKGIIKSIGGELESTLAAITGKEGGQGESSASGDPAGAKASLGKPPSNEVDNDEDEFETYIEVVEDEEDVPEAPAEVEEPTASGGAGASDQFGFQDGETISGDGVDVGDVSAEEIAAKKARSNETTKVTRRPQANLKPIQTIATCYNAAPASDATTTSVNEIQHVAHPDNKRMCVCGFTTHVTNLNKHIWRLTEGRHTTRGAHVCPKCGDRFTAKSALRKHAGAHTDGVVKKKVKSAIAPAPAPVPTKVRSSISCTCVTCQRFFPNRRALKNHRRKAHHSGSVAKKIVPKPKAVAVTMVKKAIEKVQQPQQQLHQVDMDKKKDGGSTIISAGYFCKCGNNYFTKGALIAHIRKNTQQLQFKCHLCEQRFLWNSLLVQHFQRTHKMMMPKQPSSLDGESGGGKSQAVSCSFCGEKFSKYDELYKHRKAVHGIGKKCA